MPHDPASLAGKPPVLAETADLVVVGAGPAGIAGAIEAARLGLSVMLVDENPVDPALMGLEVPLHFGQRMGGAVRDPGRLIEQMLVASPELEQAFDLGVDVRLATTAWGLFLPGNGSHTLAGPVAALAEAERSWLVGAKKLLMATGRRDAGLAFPGWETPGVMGAVAATALIARYESFSGRRIAVLGSGAEALSLALLALERGFAVAAVVEAAARPLGPPALVEQLAAAGVPLLLSCVPAGVRSGPDGVEGLVLATPAAEGQPGAGAALEIACDTIVIALGGVPNVEGLAVLGCALTHDGRRGGHVPVLDRFQRTSHPDVYAAGDCAGFDDRRTLEPELARMEARHAARAIARSLGVAADTGPEVSAPPAFEGATPAVRRHWLEAIARLGDDTVHVCQCEEVTRAELLGLRPPRYLGAAGSSGRPHDVAGLGREGPVSPDQVKRLTRAGMGPCQGRRCREQVASLVAMATGAPLDAVPLASYRIPLRPLPLRLLATTAGHPELQAHWDSWFGIESQWLPFWELRPGGAAGAPHPGLAASYGK